MRVLQGFKGAPLLPSVFAALFAASPDSIQIADEAGHYVEANSAALALLGYTREEVLGLRVGDVVAPGPSWAAEEYARFMREGTWQGEVELRTKNERVVPADARAIVVPGPDGLRYAAFLREGTDRRRREAANARVAAVVEASPDTIISLSPEDIILEWNPAAVRLYGYTAEEALGLSVTLLADPERTHEATQLLDRVRDGESIAGVETIRRTKDGRFF